MNPHDGTPRPRLGEILVQRGKLDAAALERALRLQQESGEKRTAIDGWVDDDVLVIGVREPAAHHISSPISSR